MDSTYAETDNLKATWRTWVEIAVVLFAGSILSVSLRNFNYTLLLYLPAAFAIVFIHWYGPKVLPLLFINGLFTLFLWHAPGGWLRLSIVATHEPLVAFLSWILARKVLREGEGFSSISLFAKFALFGVAIPELANCFYTYHYS